MDSANETTAGSHAESSRRQTHRRQESIVPFPTITEDVDHADALASSAVGDEDESAEEEDERIRQLKLKRATTFSKDYTEDEERAVVRKFDRKLVLFLAFLYLLSFLDRSSRSIEKTIQLARADRIRYWQCSSRRS